MKINDRWSLRSTPHMNLRDYTFLGTTRSLCPTCRRLVDAKIIVRQGRVYFRKRCPEHGLIEDFVCSDVAYYDRHEFSQPARLPQAFGTRPDKGCPYDCGLCPEHEQHTCIALVEITSSCNLKCPMCFAESGPGGKHVDFATYRSDGRPATFAWKASPTCCRSPAASRRCIPTSGAHGPLRLRAADPGSDDQHQRHPPGPRPGRWSSRAGADARPAGNLSPVRRPRGAHARPSCAARHCWRSSWRPWKRCDNTTCAARSSAPWTTTPTCTRWAGSCASGWSGPSCAASVTSWRPTAAGTSTRRIWNGAPPCPTWSRRSVAQTDGLVAESDFYPLPCAHPNCHMMCYLYRGGSQAGADHPADRRAQAHGPDGQQRRLHAGAGPAAGGRGIWRTPGAAAAVQTAAGPPTPGSTSSWSRRWPRSSRASRCSASR